MIRILDVSDEAWSAIRCPIDGLPLAREGNLLHGREGRSYPVYEGIPVLIPPDVPPTLWVAQASRDHAWRRERGDFTDPLAIQTIGLTEEERSSVAGAAAAPTDVDPVIDALIGATNGNLYKPFVRAGLPPAIPRLPEFARGLLLDVGCNWGRWSISGALQSHRVIGIDPSLGAVLAARREAARRGLSDHCFWVVGDARYLPFASSSVDGVWSYSVLQHFSVPDATRSLSEIGRVVRQGGEVRIQMANRAGLRSIWHQMRRKRRPEEFDVRYWSRRQLLAAAESSFDRAWLEPEGFLGLGMRPEDAPNFRGWRRNALRVSQLLVSIARHFSPLTALADSVYIVGQRTRSSTEA